MPYDELVRGPEFSREFAEYLKPKNAYSFLGIRSQRSGFGDKENKEVVVGLALNGDLQSYVIHPLQGPISVLRAWRTTEILNEMHYIAGPATVTDAYYLLGGEEPNKNGYNVVSTPFQRLDADFSRRLVQQRRLHNPELAFVPEKQMDIVAQYVGVHAFKAMLSDVQNRVPPSEKLVEMEKAVIDFGLELDQEDLQKARELLSQQQAVPVMGLA